MRQLWLDQGTPSTQTEMPIITERVLFDFDQEFSTAENEIKIVNAFVEVDGNEDGPGVVVAQISEGCDSWLDVAILVVAMQWVTGPAIKSGLSFVVPPSKRFRIHENTNPALGNQTDFMMVATMTFP